MVCVNQIFQLSSVYFINVIVLMKIQQGIISSWTIRGIIKNPNMMQIKDNKKL